MDALDGWTRTEHTADVAGRAVDVARDEPWGQFNSVDRENGGERPIDLCDTMIVVNGPVR